MEHSPQTYWWRVRAINYTKDRDTAASTPSPFSLQHKLHRVFCVHVHVVLTPVHRSKIAEAYYYSYYFGLSLLYVHFCKLLVILPHPSHFSFPAQHSLINYSLNHILFLTCLEINYYYKCSQLIFVFSFI